MYRLGLFARSVEIVNTHNTQYPDDHVVGLNYMADWSSEEYKAILGLRVLDELTKKQDRSEK